MKKNLTLRVAITLFAVCLISASCAKTRTEIIEVPYENVESLITTIDNLELGYAQADIYIGVVTDAEEWNIEVSDKAWLNTKSVNDGLILTASENTSSEAREGYIVISAKDAHDKKIKISQRAYGEHLDSDLEVDLLTLNFKYSDVSEKEINVTSDARWWNATAEQSWISVDMSDKAFTVSVETNEGEPRVGFITVTALGAQPVTIKVLQRGYEDYIYTGDELEFDFMVGMFDFEGTPIMDPQAIYDGATSPTQWQMTFNKGAYTDFGLYTFSLDNFAGSNKQGLYLDYDENIKAAYLQCANLHDKVSYKSYYYSIYQVPCRITVDNAGARWIHPVKWYAIYDEAAKTLTWERDTGEEPYYCVIVWYTSGGFVGFYGTDFYSDLVMTRTGDVPADACGMPHEFKESRIYMPVRDQNKIMHDISVAMSKLSSDEIDRLVGDSF